MCPTVQELEKALKAIGWTFRRCGCGYLRVRDHRGRDTAWLSSEDYPQLKYDPAPARRGAFGEKPSDCGAQGAVVFMLDHCKIETDIDHSMVSVMPVNNHHIFISFYNFDIRDKRKSRKVGGK